MRNHNDSPEPAFDARKVAQNREMVAGVGFFTEVFILTDYLGSMLPYLCVLK
jgi:hypothetical protein